MPSWIQTLLWFITIPCLFIGSVAAFEYAGNALGAGDTHYACIETPRGTELCGKVSP